MVSSTTIQSHPQSSSLSNLQGPSPASNSPNSSSTVVTASTSSPLAVSASRETKFNSNTIGKEDSENLTQETVSVATAISFATPEHSPFLAQRKVTELTSLSRASTDTTSSEFHDSISQEATADSTSTTSATMSASKHTPVGNETICSEGETQNTANSSLSTATSVTPQEKCVKFKEIRTLNQMDEGDKLKRQGGAVPSSTSALTGVNVSMPSSGVSSTIPANQQGFTISATPNIPNLSCDSAENNQNSSQTTPLAPTTTATTQISSVPITTTGNISSIHYPSSVSRRGGKVATCPSPGRVVSNSSNQSTPSSIECRNNTSSNINIHNNNVNHGSHSGTDINIHSVNSLSSTPKNHLSNTNNNQAATTTSTTNPQNTGTADRLSSVTVATSASPSRIPSLQPRKLSVSSNCIETASIPPSLCSSASNTPETDVKLKAQGNEDHQFLGRTVGESTVHAKLENEGNESHDQSSKHQNESLNNVNQSSDDAGVNGSSSTKASSDNNTNVVINNLLVKNRNTSPVPNANQRPMQARTPVRSPKNGRSFNVDFGSPGIFLSPYLPSPPDSRKTGFQGGNSERGHKTATPTNFAKDFGKTDLSSSSFDATNVLPWLSPTSYSLFSPGGGIASASNTPGGMFSTTLPRTPRSPNSNKLSLPLTNEVMVGGGGLDTKKKVNGISSMICVSPLASRKSTNTNTSSVKIENCQSSSGTAVGSTNIGGSELTQPDTPINFREVFASPKTDGKGVIQADQSNEIPTLAETNDEICTSLSLEKHMAERDVREDEDLNVLLKLAETTPNRKATEPKPTTRPQRTQFYPNHPGAMYPISQGSGEPPASLHLPYIGKSTNLLTKPTTISSDSNKDVPPQLPIRTNSSSPSKRSKNDEQKGPTKEPIQKGSTVPPPKGIYPYPPPHLHHPPPPGVYPPPPPHYIHGPYYSYPHPHHGPGHPPPPPYTMYSNAPAPAKPESAKKGQKVKTIPAKVTSVKRPLSTPNIESKKRQKKTSTRKGGKRTRTTVTQPLTGPERQKSAATITAINAATGNKNDKAASLASAILRGVTMRPSGKWQAQLYYAGKSRYIGVFDTREKAALAYEIAREKLKTDKPASEQSAQSLKETEANVNAARKAAFEGVNEKDPRNGK